MPRYFFNVRDDLNVVDDEGTELPDDFAAWQQATKTCGQMIRDLDGKLVPGAEWRMQVRNESGAPVYTIEVVTKTYV